jgi:predicted alpha-1,2-mannosidase
MRKYIFLICVFSSVFAFAQNYTKYVDPFIGTQSMGHVYPGATVPFGMVQLSPETDQQPMFLEEGTYNKKTYEYCSGYQYEDASIFGFAHTHFSGTGHSDLGDLLMMPTIGDLQLNPGTKENPDEGFASRFSHKQEHAEPGYYSVFLQDDEIQVELTSSERVGMHKYSYPKTEKAHVILDLISNIYNYDGKNIWTFLRLENDTLITGYRQTSGWARTRTVYFAMAFSKPIKEYGYKRYDEVKYNGFYRKFNESKNFPEMAGRDIRAWFDFNLEESQELLVKVALSNTSTHGALKNLEAEIPHWDFEKVKQEAQAKWEKELSKVQVEMETEAQMQTFYTALYHTFLSPILYEDVDGVYRGLDQNNHQSDGFVNYTIFSLWDTYRALHPWFNLVQPARNNDMMHSMLAHHDQSVHDMLPIWSHYANENWCMVGYHSVSAIADAIVKGTTDVDLNRALKASVNTSRVPYFDGLDSYMKLGYVAEDLSGSSVSKTLEYAYDDWCIAQIAERAGEELVKNQYLQRAKNFEKVYDAEIGYMRPKLANGEWREHFDPIDTHGQGFIEGNAWNYGLYVPHEVDQMIEMMGGKDQFSKHLDRIFTTPIDDEHIAQNEDITRDGIIGNYVHGNEPGHHIPYLYNWTNDAWKTQERVRMIMDEMYGTGPDGVCGNDDAGQMSAWYTFSALGFYPVLPGSDEYAIGSPLVKSAVLNFENGSSLSIIAHYQSPEHIYVKKVLWNGEEVKNNTLLHSELLKGGQLEFFMSKRK